MNPVACRSCGAPMFWTRTTNNKPMPVDARPSPNGSFFLEAVVDEPEPIAKFVHPGDRSNYDELHDSHFATCPTAAKHRKKGTH